jgi:hypothetical protein
MDVVTFKYIAMISLFVMAMAGGLWPMKIGKAPNAKVFLSLGNTFGGGVFLGGGLLHLLPESNENLLTVSETLNMPSLQSYPFAFLLCGLGFFAILIVEEVALASAHTEAPTKKEIKTLVKVEKDRLKAARIRDRAVRAQRGQVVNSPLGSPRVQEQEFLKMYFGSRQLARNVVTSLAPRSGLLYETGDGPLAPEGPPSSSVDSPVRWGPDSPVTRSKTARVSSRVGKASSLKMLSEPLLNAEDLDAHSDTGTTRTGSRRNSDPDGYTSVGNHHSLNISLAAVTESQTLARSQEATETFSSTSHSITTTTSLVQKSDKFSDPSTMKLEDHNNLNGHGHAHGG